MSSGKRGVGICGVLFFTILAALAPRAASADGDNDGLNASLPGVTFGGRASYFRPHDADNGSLYGGAQLRLHIGSVLALEGSADYRQNKYGGTIVDVYPVQGSLMIYLLPHSIVSPYILGGEGWYYTHVRGPNGSTSNRFGPHAGAGLELALSRHWSIDGSYRYLWTQSLTAPTTTSPVGKNFSDNGFMLTAAVNYRF